MSTGLIGLDWGSTHLRAYRYDGESRVLEKRALGHGVRQLPAGGDVHVIGAAKQAGLYCVPGVATPTEAFAALAAGADALMVGITFLTLLNGIGNANTFWLYAALNAVFIVLTYWLAPETKGVTLEQIERNLMGGKRLRDIGR
ncbi:2-keto-3-deoxy-galactonokinase [Dyella jiangningensis]|uniref:MFS transporter n=1 Tax=Dyella sp. AtDHG13 TaxID=1938897 RepID=UPI00087E80A4|nr:MFS transporter [Dyella sp. AtDHG13]PXV51874.1 2-keto-3-deoxy-galactonokinase [Dyella sp. AtDHG13]SDL59157.1 2-keto-3-deoxy-galactonokinase [Dyella jiangningensis]